MRGMAGLHSNTILQWIGGSVGAALGAIIILLVMLAVDPPDVLDPVMVFAYVAPIVGTVAATVEFVLLVFARLTGSPLRNRAWIEMVVMFGIGSLCVLWLMWYTSQLNRRWAEPPPAPVPAPGKRANHS